MALSAVDAERDVMHRAKSDHDAGRDVSDDLYRYMLKKHDAGEHAGIKLNTCPSCQFPS